MMMVIVPVSAMLHHGGRYFSLRKRSVLTPQCPQCQDDDGAHLYNFRLVGTSPLHCWSQDAPSVFLSHSYYVFSFDLNKDC